MQLFEILHFNIIGILSRYYLYIAVVVVQSHNAVQLFVIPWTAGFPVHHQHTEFVQTNVHWVNNAIQSSYSLLSPSLPAFNLSQHQGFFKWVSSLRQVAIGVSASVFSPSKEYPGVISFRIDWLNILQSKGLSRVFSNTTVQKHQFFVTQPSLWSNSHIHTWLMEKL